MDLKMTDGYDKRLLKGKKMIIVIISSCDLTK